MAMRIDQVGLSAGIPGFARKDGKSDGSKVTLTDTTPGGTTRFDILWVAPFDVSAVSTLKASTTDSHVWTFTPTSGVTGPIRIRLTHTGVDNVVATETRIFGIPDDAGAVPPAPGERSDPNATLLNATNAGIIARCERNWPTLAFPAGNPFGWGFDLSTGGGSIGIGALPFADDVITADAVLDQVNQIYRVDASDASTSVDITLPLYPQQSDRVGVMSVGSGPVKVVVSEGQTLHDPQVVGEVNDVSLSWGGDAIVFIFDADETVWRVDYWTSPTVLIDPMPDPISGSSGGSGGSGGATTGTATALATTGTAVNVAAASPPAAGQVLTATSTTAAHWSTPAVGGGGSTGPAEEIATNTSNPVAVLASPPTAGQVLTATSPIAAHWAPPTIAPAAALRSATTTINIGDGAPPQAGQALIAISSTEANWADIEAPASSGPAGALSVNSGSASVSIAGSPAPSEDQVLTATSSATARWQDSAAKKLLTAEGGAVDVGTADAPVAGQILTATSGTTAEWADPPGASGGSVTALLLATNPGDAAIDIESFPPTSGQVLIATDATHASWGDVPSSGGGPAIELATADPALTVNLDGASAPLAGQVLTAVDETHAAWQDLPPGGGGEPGPAIALATGDGTNPSTGAVSIGTAIPPVANQILIAIDQEHAQWADNVPYGLYSDDGPVWLYGPPTPGNVLTADGSGGAAWAPVSGGGGGGAARLNIYLDAPGVPDAFDDEFADGSPDLAVRGWEIRDSNPGVLVREGDVDFWNGGAVTWAKYRSTMIGGALYLQIYSGGTGTVSITRAASESGLYACRVSSVANGMSDTGGSGGRGSHGIRGIAAPADWSAARVVCWSTNAYLSRNTQWRLQFQSPSVTQDLINNSSAMQDIFALNYVVDTSIRAVAVATGNEGIAWSPSVAPIAIVRVGFELARGYTGGDPAMSASADSPTIFRIGFCRKYAANSWFGH